MHQINNEKGVSLVELIAALALVAMVAVLIMTTLSIGIQKSIVEGEKTKIQQEANLMVAKLLNIHREGKCYELKIAEDAGEKYLNATVYSEGVSAACGTNIEKEIAIYYQNYEISTTESSISTEIINPTIKNNPISIVLILESRRTITYEISTTLSRYKTN